MAFDPIAAPAGVEAEGSCAAGAVAWVRQENEQLRKEIEQLRRREKQGEQERDQLRQENERLKRQLEEAQQAQQATSRTLFSRHAQSQSANPGRKSGAAYGRRYSKAIPEKVDEVIPVPPPAQCECGGPLEVERIESQYQQEIIRKTFWRRFDIAICGNGMTPE